MVVKNLMEIALIKNYASEKKFTEIKGGSKSLDLYFDPENAPDLTECINLAEKNTGKLFIKNGTKPKVTYLFAQQKNQEEYLNIVKEFIKKL